MSRFNIPDLAVLKDRVVVLTGGSMGIGAALVRLLHKNGAHVFFGDIETSAGQQLAQELSSPSGSHVQFVHTDVSSYAANLKLFETAYTKFTRIDHAVSAAGIGEIGNLVNPELTIETVREEPTTKVVDVNLKGPIYFSRLASVYLRQNASSGQDRSLTLVSSVAGITESPGLFQYSASKHGVIGLMRAFRKYFPTSSPIPIRSNAICPWMTLTRLAEGIEAGWKRAGLPTNTPEDVAVVIAGVVADGKINGGALYVEGGRAWETEKGVDDARTQWMGGDGQNAKVFDEGQGVLGSGELWIAKKGS